MQMEERTGEQGQESKQGQDRTGNDTRGEERKGKERKGQNMEHTEMCVIESTE
jgi:hypothetical protein